jgi:hypothetical protein
VDERFPRGIHPEWVNLHRARQHRMYQGKLTARLRREPLRCTTKEFAAKRFYSSNAGFVKHFLLGTLHRPVAV